MMARIASVMAVAELPILGDVERREATKQGREERRIASDPQ
jgi:hypothetical protein